MAQLQARRTCSFILALRYLWSCVQLHYSDKMIHDLRSECGDLRESNELESGDLLGRSAKPVLANGCRADFDFVPMLIFSREGLKRHAGYMCWDVMYGDVQLRESVEGAAVPRHL